MNLNKKTQVLTPENLGEMIFEVVNLTVPALLNPQMSASWEKGLDGITKGTVDFWEYREKLEDFIRKETLKMIDQNLRSQLAERISEFAGKNARGIGARRKIGVKCPVCDGELVTTPFGYGCSNYKADKTGCGFNIGEIAGILLSEEQVKALLETGHTDTIRGFKSKSGKKFDAVLKLEKDEEGHSNIAFDFESVEMEYLPDVTCPACGGRLVKTSFGFRCENFKSRKPNSEEPVNPFEEEKPVLEETEGCYFSVGTIAGKILTAANVKQLLTEGKTETLRGFKSKAGKKFDACLILSKDENDKSIISFDFEHVEAKKIKDVVCPICGGDIVTTPFGFGCANYNKDVEGSCRFSIGKMADKALTETNVKELLTNGITGTIRGFKSKTGKKFDARVALSKNEAGEITGLKFDFNDLEPVKVKDVVCPLCGGDVVVTPFGYGCSNYNKDDQEHSCRFMIGKIASVKLKETHVKQLLTEGKTEVIEGFVARTGMKFDAPLKLTEDGQVTFDFPEKAKPVESNVECPKCGKKMLKGQWQYECECGFKLWHTVAKVALPEETIIELLTTGKTKKKIVGFTSKAGNVFDTCLKYEDDTIKFDFDNPGEEEPGENSTPKDNKVDFSNEESMMIELPPVEEN